MSFDLVVFEATRYRAGDIVWALDDCFWVGRIGEPEVKEVKPERVLQNNGTWKEYSRYSLVNDEISVDVQTVGRKSSMGYLVDNVGSDYAFQDSGEMWQEISDLIINVFKDVDSKVKTPINQISILTLWHYTVEQSFNGEEYDYEEYWHMVGVVTDEMLGGLAERLTTNKRGV